MPKNERMLFWRFVLIWLKRVFWAEDIVPKITNYILLLSIPVIGWSLSNSPSRFSFNHNQLAYGMLLSIAIGAILLLWNGGIAWVHAGRPKMRINDQPQPDEPRKMFRLRVGNEGPGELQPTAVAQSCKTLAGQLQESNFPIPLHLSHHHAKVPYKGQTTIAILQTEVNGNVGIFIPMSDGQSVHPIIWGQHEPVYLEIMVWATPQAKPISIFFHVQRSDGPMHYRIQRIKALPV